MKFWLHINPPDNLDIRQADKKPHSFNVKMLRLMNSKDKTEIYEIIENWGGDIRWINKFRALKGIRPIQSRIGYCMSTGCSCTSVHKPYCGLFRNYDGDGIKKDFLYQLLGI